MSDNCIFCKLLGDAILETNEFYVIKDVNPLHNTHLLVITKAHVEFYTGALLKRAITFAEKITKKFDLKNYKLMVNKGAPFQQVFHAHLHIISDTFP